MRGKKKRRASHEEPKSLRLTRSGGVTGLARCWDWPWTDVPAGARAALVRGVPERGTKGLARDLWEYKFTLVLKGKEKKFVCDDYCLPKPLRKFVDELA